MLVLGARGLLVASGGLAVVSSQKTCPVAVHGWGSSLWNETYQDFLYRQDSYPPKPLLGLRGLDKVPWYCSSHRSRSLRCQLRKTPKQHDSKLCLALADEAGGRRVPRLNSDDLCLN